MDSGGMPTSHESFSGDTVKGPVGLLGLLKNYALHSGNYLLL